MDQSAVRTMLRRARLTQVYDDDGQQFVKGRGLKGEEFDRILRIQPHGFTSTPQADSVGLIMALGGRSDRLVALGFESDGLRPKTLGAGATALYDAHGNIISLVQGNLRIKAADGMVIEAPGATITFSGGTIAIESAGLTHNGKNISFTHVHTGVTPGAANTGAPA